MEEKMGTKIEEAGRIEEEKKIKFAEETPEKKAEREYQENIQRITLEAESFIQEDKAKRLRDELVLQETELPSPKPAMTIEKQKLLDTKRGFLESQKDKLRELSFKLKGIKKAEELICLVNYLEENIVKTGHNYIKVAESETEKKMAEYQERGYRVEKVHYYDESESKIRIEKDIPYKFLIKDAKKIAQLLEQPNDPVEILEKLKRIGFHIDNFDLKHRLKDLQSLVASPEVGELLKKLEQTGIKGFYGLETDTNKFLNLALDDSKKNILTPETQKELSLIAKTLNRPLNLQEIDDCLILAKDKNCLELLLSLKGRLDDYDLKNRPILKNLRWLQEEKLVEPIMRLFSLNIYFPVEKMFSYDAESLEGAKKAIKELRINLEKPELQEFLENKDLLDFTNKLSLIAGRKISLQELDKYKELQQYPETLALFELLREWPIEIADYQWGSRFDDILGLLKDKEKLSILIKPEFGEFVRNLGEQLGYKMEFYDFQYEHCSIIKLFQDSEIHKQLFSKEEKELIDYLGGFYINKQDSYKKLLKTPNILPILQKTEKIFGYHHGKTGKVDEGVKDLINLAESEELQKELFGAETKNFFDRLAKEFDYKFSPWLPEIVKLKNLAQDNDFQKRLFAKANQEFIKKSAGGFGLEDLELLTNLEQELRPLIAKLVDNFGYKVQAYSWQHNDKSILQNLLANQELQNQLFSNKRVVLIKQIMADSLYHLKLQNIEALVKLPLNFSGFLKELSLATGYSFAIKDLEQLGKFGEHKENLFELLAGFRKSNISYQFSILDTDNLIEMTQYPTEKIIEKITFYSQVVPDPKSQFHPSGFKYFQCLIEKDYELEEIKDLMQIYNQYKSQDIGEFSSILIPFLIEFRENKDIILQASKEITELLGREINPLKEAVLLKEIVENNLLPTLQFLQTHGNIQSSWRQIDKLKEFRTNPNYQNIIEQYKIFYQKMINRPFNLGETEWYEKLAGIENLEKKLELFADRHGELVNKLPEKELKQRTNLRAINKASFLQDQVFKLFIACQADPEKFFNIYYSLDDPYFREGKDAQANLQKFLQRFEAGNYPDDIFIKIMTSSKEAKNVKRLLLKIMALENVQDAADPSQKINWDFLEQTQKYNEIFQKANKVFIEKVGQLFFEDEKTKEEIRDKIEKLLLEDEQFEDDFRVMIDSVGIYAQKYSKTSETFNELMRAIRQALELDFVRDPEEYKQERFKRSKEQFDRIFEQLPKINRQETEEKWLDTSLAIRDSLDQTSVTQKQTLKNKLNEIRTTFETEILPDLTFLFQEKLKNLEDLIQTGDKKAELFKARLEIFQKYLVDEKGDARTDIVDMFRVLAQDIRSGEKILKSKNAEQEKKKKVSKNLGIIKSLKDVLKGIYKLSAIKPDKLDIKTDYAVEIDEVVDLLSGSLHKLAIVDKEKKEAANIGSNLEIDLRDHLNHLQEVIKEEDHPKKIKIQTQFATDFNNLARCPELTGSCQRLTEVTNFNEAAYSRILDGINELIDLWEVKTTKNSKGKATATKHQRLARCFTELAPIKIEDKEPRLAILLDRIYTHPEYSTFQHKFAENIIKLALERFQNQKEISIFFSPSQFSDYQELIKSLAEEYGYRFLETENINYFVNESHLKISQGKYYDAHGGLHNTSTSYYDAMGSGYILEKI
ncbi:MAG: hypothetical protein ABIG90_00045 [bacterium]